MNADDLLWNILNDTEDLLRGGYRRNPPPLISRQQSIRILNDEIARCTACGLCKERTKTVPGTGVQSPLVLVIGEGPGVEEDRAGLPFVGPAGKYLDKWLSAIGISREENCYISNIVKCRPPGNRDPLPEESTTCLPYLYQLIDILKPRSILTVGRIAAQILLNSASGIGAMRGNRYDFKGIPLFPTYHPSGVLRNPEYRRFVWSDLKLLKRFLDDE